MEQRPQLQRLLDNIERFDGILVIELSRLSRNGLISETVLQYCKDYDKPILTPDKVYDLANSSTDETMYKFGSLIASQEHALIGRRSKNNKISMAKQGLHISGGIPFGYRRNDSTKRLEIFESEAQVVRYIFQLHSEGLGSRKIVDTLNREGYKPQRSEAFQLPTVKRIIQNPAYKGTVVFQDRKRIKENGKFVFKIVNTIESHDAHEPIISVDQWDNANRERAIRADQARVYRDKPAPKTGTTMLKDLLYCGLCGRKLVIRKELNGTYSIKPCEYQLPNSAEKCTNNGIKLEYIEADIIDALKAHEEQMQHELSLLEQQDLSSIESDLKEKLAHIDIQIAENQRQQTALIDLAVSGIFTHDELKVKRQALIDMGQALEQSRDKLIEQSESINVTSHIERMSQVFKLLNGFESLPVEAQNRALKQFIKKIHFTRNMPLEIRMLSTRNQIRREFPYDLSIEYF
ncbi:DNA invertase Pin-like site-specific DNA recombinase [Paenibacillus qinlingensis]|uniref:DNA invertase Pin-like site-specific DNA recombinase n=2 Tax=Paenibacillus qinlingensis TaxID=1837343 RepID=A0ABU1NRA3_9BACL|nr:DNA invertase Pin-like site-specific DNA recombinase [Paenibacillus qinlingensis]